MPRFRDKLLFWSVWAAIIAAAFWVGGWIAASWAVCSLATMLITAGWLFAYQQEFPGLSAEDAPQVLGVAMLIGLMCGIIFPLGLVLAYCVTGFAHCGWTLKLEE